MRGSDMRMGELFSYVDLEERVPPKHPLRLIRRRIVNDVLAALDGEFTKLYAAQGRPSIAPERLLRALLLQAFYTFRHRGDRIEISQCKRFGPPPVAVDTVTAPMTLSACGGSPPTASMLVSPHRIGAAASGPKHPKSRRTKPPLLVCSPHHAQAMRPNRPRRCLPSLSPAKSVSAQGKFDPGGCFARRR
jgi:hypothetical protein